MAAKKKVPPAVQVDTSKSVDVSEFETAPLERLYDGNVMISAIHTGKNIRKDFSVDAHEALMGSIKEHGILNPLIVMHSPEKSGEFELIAGGRRLMAAQHLGLHTVPCYVYPVLSDVQLYDVMVTENLLRLDLNPIEEAEGFRKLIDLGMTQEQLGDRIKKSREYVANRLRLLSAPAELQEMIVSRETHPSHVLFLMRYKDRPIMEDMARVFREVNKKCMEERDESLPVKEILDSIGPVLLPHEDKDTRKQLKGKFGDLSVIRDIDWSTYQSCLSCENGIQMRTARYQSGAFCFDPECYERKLGEVKAAKKAESLQKKEAKASLGKRFYKEDEWEHSRYPLLRSDCSCDQVVERDGDFYCMNEECYKKTNDAKIARIEEASNIKKALLKSVMIDFCKTGDVAAMTSLLLQYCSGRLVDGDTFIDLHGKPMKDCSWEEKLRAVALYILYDQSNVRWTHSILNDEKLGKFAGFLAEADVAVPESFAKLLPPPIIEEEPMDLPEDGVTDDDYEDDEDEE